MSDHGGKRPKAGRPKGAVSKLHDKARKEAAKGGITPLDFMLSILRDEDNTTEDRFEAAKAAAPYMHAKLSTIDATNKNEGTMTLIVETGVPRAPDGE
jgi:hypothetical protein